MMFNRWVDGGLTVSVTYAISLIVPAFLLLYEQKECTQFECCNDRWIPSNDTLLRELLAEKLYGESTFYYLV